MSMWQMGPQPMNRVCKALVESSIYSSYLVENDEMVYSLRKDLKPKSTPELAEYSDISTEAAMPKRQAGAMIESSFMVEFVMYCGDG